MMFIKNYNELTQRQKAKRSVHCAVFMFFCAVCCVLIAVASYNHTQTLIQNCTSVVSGTVYHVGTGRYITPYVSASYYVNDTRHTADGLVERKDFHYDAVVKVHYNPMNVNEAYVGYAPRSVNYAALTFFTILFLLSIPAFIKQGKRELVSITQEDLWKEDLEG